MLRLFVSNVLTLKYSQYVNQNTEKYVGDKVYLHFEHDRSLEVALCLCSLKVQWRRLHHDDAESCKI